MLALFRERRMRSPRPIESLPLGSPNAQKTVQWTVPQKPSPLEARTPGKQSGKPSPIAFPLVDRSLKAFPYGEGGFRRNCLQFCRKTNEVVCQASPLSHLHHLFYPPPISTQYCRGFPADCRQVKPFFVSITYLVRVRPHPSALRAGRLCGIRPHPSALRAATFPKGEGDRLSCEVQHPKKGDNTAKLV